MPGNSVISPTCISAANRLAGELMTTARRFRGQPRVISIKASPVIRRQSGILPLANQVIHLQLSIDHRSLVRHRQLLKLQFFSRNHYLDLSTVLSVSQRLDLFLLQCTKILYPLV